MSSRQDGGEHGGAGGEKERRRNPIVQTCEHAIRAVDGHQI